VSRIVSLYYSFDFACPHCWGYNEIDDIDVFVTIEGIDVTRGVYEWSFDHECKHCGGKFQVTPHMHIRVKAI
jgi:hypothetical protein